MTTLRAIIFLVVASLCAGALSPRAGVVAGGRQAAAAPSGTAFISSVTTGTLRSNFSGGVGFTFVAAANVTATHLGRWVVSGNSGTHTVSIYSGADLASGTLLGSVSINTSGATAGQFSYAALASSVAISSGTRYWVLSSETNGGDQWYDFNTTVTYTGITGALVGAYRDSVNHVSSNGDGKVYVPVSLLYN